MVSSSNSYATTTHPAGQELQMQQGGTASATVQWKPAPVDVDDEDETDDNGKKKRGSVDLASAEQLTQEAVNQQAKATEAEIFARARLRRINRKRFNSGDVRFVYRRDEDGNLRMEIVLGKDELLTIAPVDTLAFWNTPEGYIPAFFPQMYIPDGRSSVAVGAKQTITLPPTATGTLPAVPVKPMAGYTGIPTGATAHTNNATAHPTTVASSTLTTTHTRFAAPAPNYSWFGGGHHTTRPRTGKTTATVETTPTGKDIDKDKEDEDELAVTEGGQSPIQIRHATLTGTPVATIGSAPATDTPGKGTVTYPDSAATTPGATSAPRLAIPRSVGAALSAQAPQLTANSLTPPALAADAPVQAAVPTGLVLSSADGGVTPPVQDSYTVDANTSWFHDTDIATTKPERIVSPSTSDNTPGLVISGADGAWDYYASATDPEPLTLASSVIASKTVYVEAGGELILSLANVRNNRATNINLDVSKVAGSGTINLVPQSTGNVTYKSVASMAFNGTLVFNGSIQHIFSGSTSSTTSGSFQEVDGKYADIHLLASPSGVTGKGLLVGPYAETNALNIGNLSGEAGSHIVGYGNGTAHYLSVHQTEDTVFAGIADNTSSKQPSILKSGNGTLVLTGANESKGDLKANEGWLVLAGADGNWTGNISIGENGTLAYAGAAVADGGAPVVKKTTSFTGFTSDADGTLKILGQGVVAGTEYAAGKLMVNSDIKAGKVVVDEGGMLIVGDPDNANVGILTVASTMEINGALMVNSKIRVTDMANLEREGDGVVYSDSKAEGAGIVDFGNGYGKSVYVLYRGSGTVTGLTTVYVEGTDDEYEVGTAGKVWVAESVGRYCINKGTVVYGDDRNSASDEVNTKTLVLNGGTLEMAQDLKAVHSINLAQESTMIIDAGVVVKNSQITEISATLNIIGEGTYDLGTGTVSKTLADSVNPYVQFGSGWTGDIRVSGLELGGGDNAIRELYGLDHEHGWVELSDSKGYLDGRHRELVDVYGPGEEEEEGVEPGQVVVGQEYRYDADNNIALNLRLTGHNALVINKSNYDDLGHDTVFTGKMAGTGDLVVTAFDDFNAADDSFIFTGDVTAWTGNFILEHNADELNGTNVAGWDESKAIKLVKLTGPGDVNVNFSVTHTGDNANSMNVEIAGDAARTVGSNFSHGEEDTLNLTLTGAGTKTFTGDVQVSTLTATGAQASFNSTLTADTLEIGTAEAAGDLVLGGTSTLNTVHVNNGSLSFAEGAVINANGEFYVADGLTAGGTNAVTFNGGAGFTKTGAGTLELTGTSDFTAAAVREGTLKLDTQGNHTYTNISLGHSEGGVDTVGTLVINNTAAHADADTMTGLTLNHDAELQVIGAGARATLDSTVLNGNTLTLRDSHTTEGILSAYYFTGASAGEGTLVISQDPVATPANVAVTIKGENTFKDAVIRFDATPIGGVNTLAVGADNVKVAALQGTGDSLYLISRETFEAVGTDLTTSGTATRTLTITGNGEANTFNGTLGANLNIVMAGAGTQKFTGNASALSGDITVNEGSMEFTSTVGSDTAPLTSIAVNSGTLNMAGGYTNDLTVSGSLNLTAGTLTVNGTLRVDNGSTLNISDESTGLTLGQHYVLDLEGLTSTEVEEGVFAYQLFTAVTAAKVTGISNGEIDMSHIRTNGIGWSAEYADGLLTLTRMKIVVWNSPSQATATWTPDSAEFVDGEQIGTNGKANVKVATNLEATIGRSVVVQSLGVNEGISFTLTGADNEKTFTFKDINLEEGSTLDASGVNLVRKSGEICTVDLSAGATFITKAVTGGVYTGTGTVQIGFGTGTGSVTMGEGSQFRGLVDVTAGTVALGTSSISNGTWQLKAGVNGDISGTVSNNIVLVGSNHTLTAADAATIAGAIGGTDAGFTKAGAGNLTISGTADLSTMTVSAGTVDIAGKTTLGDLNVETGAGLATTPTANLTINGMLTSAEDITVSAGLLTMGAAFAKAGVGTLIVTDGATFSATGLAIREGAVQFNTGNATGAAIELGDVTMAGGTKLIQSGSVATVATHRQVHVDSLSLTGDASIEGAQDNGHFVIGNTTLGGYTLTLNAAGDSDAWAVYQLTGTQNATDTASAVAVSGKGNTQLSLSDGAALGKSTLTLGDPENNRTGVMALAADEVQMLGVNGGSAWKLVSNAGLAAGSSTNGVDALEGDGAVRTLTITGDGGEFAGTIGRNVNIVMNGNGGIQKFTGNVSAMDGAITVERGELSFSNALATGNTVTLNGGSLKLGANASFAGITGSAGSSLNTVTGETYTLTLTGEGGNFAGNLDKMNITLASTATGTHEFSGTTPPSFDKLTVAGGTLVLKEDATVGTLTMTGGAIADSGELTVTQLAVTGGSITGTDIVYVGTEGEAILGADMSDASLKVAKDAGAITLTGPTKNLTNLTILQSHRTTDDILLDADVTVSGSLHLDEGAQIGFGDNRQLFYQGFTYTTDSDSDTHGTISKSAQGGNVTATNLRIMRKDSGDAAIDFTLKNVKLVNGAGAGNTTLTATGNELSEIIVTSGKVTLMEDTVVTNDVTLAVGSAQLEVATGKALTNGVITMTSRDSTDLLLDNTTTAASVFRGGLEGSSAIIGNAAVTVVVPADLDGSYTWGAKLVDSTLDLTGDLYLSNSNQHTLDALTLATDSTLTFKNGSNLAMPGALYAATFDKKDATISNNGAATAEVSIGNADLTFSNTAITLTQDPGVSFLAGAKNVDLEMNYVGIPTDPVFISPGAGREGERSFHDIVLTNGDVRLADSVTLTGDLYVANGNTLYINEGTQLVSDGGTICIKGVGKEGEEYATIDFDHGYVHGADYSRLNGASASVKVTGAEVTLTNSGTDTYVWRAALSESSLTTTGDVTLNYDNNKIKITHKLTDLNVISGTTTLKDDVEISGVAMLGAGAKLVENQYNSITDGYIVIYNDNYNGSTITNGTGSAASVFGNNGVANQGVSISLAQVTLHSDPDNTYTWGAAFEGGVKLLIGDTKQEVAHLTLTNTSTTHTFSDIQFAKSSSLTLKNGFSMYYNNGSSTGVMLTEANIEGKDATITNRRDFYGYDTTPSYSKGFTAILLQDATLTMFAGGTLYMPVSNVDLVVTKDSSIDKLGSSILKIDYTAAQNEDFGYGDRKLEFRNIKALNGGEVCIDTHSITVSQNVEIGAGSYVTIKGDGGALHKVETIYRPDGSRTSIFVNDGDRGHSLIVDDGILTITGKKDFTEGSGKAALTPGSNVIATVITQDGEGSSSLLAGADASAKVVWADINLHNTKAETYVWGAYLENSTLKVAGTADLTNAKGAKLSDLKVGYYDEEQPGADTWESVWTVKNYITTEQTADADLTVRGKLEVDTVLVREECKLTAAGGATINDSVTAHGETTFGNSASRTTTEGAEETLRDITVDAGLTLHAINSPLSYLDISRAGDEGVILLDLVGGAPLGENDGNAIAGKVLDPEAGPGSLKALMNDCSLKNADVVVTGTGAIDQAAVVSGDFWHQEFTLNVFSNVTIGEDVTIALAGMENYYDIVLYIRTVGPAASSAMDMPAISGANTSGVDRILYTGKVDLWENYSGKVVDVWVSFGVPEPTTGALAVLALAGLAARRRRKR